MRGRLDPMSQKVLVLDAIQELPDNVSIEQIADRVEFMAGIQKGMDDVDCGDIIPHDAIKKQLATWLTE
jgi:predicted transcriptional regulator